MCQLGRITKDGEKVRKQRGVREGEEEKNRGKGRKQRDSWHSRAWWMDSSLLA